MFDWYDFLCDVSETKQQSQVTISKYWEIFTFLKKIGYLFITSTILNTYLLLSFQYNRFQLPMKTNESDIFQLSEETD